MADIKKAKFATGRRKSAVARVRITEGKGTILINRLPVNDYFADEANRLAINDPLLTIEKLGKIDIEAFVKGGGHSGQAEAIRLGLARALVNEFPDLRTDLKKGGYLTRDSRVKERKKYGRAGARKRFQFSKR